MPAKSVGNYAPSKSGVESVMQRIRTVALRTQVSWMLILPVVILFVAVFAYPVFDALRRSFTDFNGPEQGGLDNYKWLLSTDVNLAVMLRTFQIAGVVTAGAALIAYPYAYLMTIVSPRWRALMVVIVLVPFWTSLLVRTYAWIVLLQDDGLVNQALGFLGVGPFRLVNNLTGVTIGMLQMLLPFMVLPVYVRMREIDRRLLLAAESLSALPSVSHLRIFLPLAMPGLVAGSLIVFVMSLGFFITPALLGSPQQSLVSQLMVTQVQQLLAFGRAGSMAVLLLVCVGVVLGLAALVARKLTTRVTGGE